MFRQLVLNPNDSWASCPCRALCTDILHWISASTFLLALASGALAQAASTSSTEAPAIPSLHIYGFLKTDFGYDLRSNDPNWFDVNRPSKLPSFENEFRQNGRTFASVRSTRFG